MTGTEISLLISGLFGGLGGLFGGGDGQERASFENEVNNGISLDPRSLLGQGLRNYKSIADAASEQARKPVQLRSAFAQQLPSFSGGGLPMGIGVLGRDPALDDPSLLETEGLNINGANGGFGQLPTDQYPSWTPSEPDPTLPPDYKPPRAPGRTPSAGGASGDSATEARAAVDLLMAGRKNA